MRNASSSSSTTIITRPAGAGRSTRKTPCCSKVGLKRGPWTPVEDQLLVNYIKKEGEGQWRTLPKRAGLLRCGKSCRLRWMNYLSPSVKRGQIAPDEEDLILRLHRLLGNRWSLIAGRIPGRTDNEIKNYWNTHLTKKLISQGIDPRTHKPINLNSSGDGQASSSKKTNKVSVIPNPNLVTSTLEEMVTACRVVASNEDDCEGTNLEQYHGGIGGNGGVDLQSSEGSEMGLRSSTHGLSNEDDNDINYCSDDLFSLFLNSLIDEDVFNGGQSQVVLQQQSTVIVPVVPDPWISSAQTMMISTIGAGRDIAPIMTSGPAFNQNDPKMANDHAC
ncbi:hypothetical protein F0562_001314 [Nyssa sinensis]|uniref:Uncharacterized protein n=1 Tax=Nyssa sinensis TaxID=561372 RepID=A0A5J5C2Y9_9ASTE|nr:hypothetical protein F0562_001314 [Nyssa sinensis]